MATSGQQLLSQNQSGLACSNIAFTFKYSAKMGTPFFTTKEKGKELLKKQSLQYGSKCNGSRINKI